MDKQHVLIIAEAGVNHNGSLKAAFELIDAAVDARADVVKFQTFTPEKVISQFAPKAEYQTKTTGAEESQLDMVRKLWISPKDHFELKAYCERSGVEFLSSPFDIDSARFLVKDLGLKRVKIPSGEITHAPYLYELAYERIPLILSTGMCSIGDIEKALGVLAYGFLRGDRSNPGVKDGSAFEQAYASPDAREYLNANVSLLHCVTEYPAPHAEANLRAMSAIKNWFQLPVGYSDHTMGISAPIAAVALGATVIEKHFTLDVTLPGPDHKASLDPAQLKEMVAAIRETEASLGTGIKAPTASELKNLPIARKSLTAHVAIKRGEEFTAANVTIKRPGSGVSPFRYWDFLGRRAERDYQADELIDGPAQGQS